MKSLIAKKTVLLIAAVLMISLVCGCETINAFRSGIVSFDDVHKMAKVERLSEPGSTSQLYLSNPPSRNDPYGCGWGTGTIKSDASRTIRGTDSWIRNNLW